MSEPHRCDDTLPTAGATRAPVQLTPLPDGPYQLTGPVEIVDPGGLPHAVTDPVYLCRCGLSAAKPLCDGSHARAGWRENP